MREWERRGEVRKQIDVPLQEAEPDLWIQLAAKLQPRDQLADKGCQDVLLPTAMLNLQS
jgi:hypothetical protein